MAVAAAAAAGVMHVSAMAFVPTNIPGSLRGTPAFRGVMAAGVPQHGISGSDDGAASALPLVGGLMVAATCVYASQARRQQRSSRLEMQATRTEWYRKVKRLPGDLAIFDVTIKKPMGLKMEVFPQYNDGKKKKNGIGISEVVEGGNADGVNREVCVLDGAGMWVLEGDQLMAVNGIDVERGTIEDVVAAVSQSDEPEVCLTLTRNTRKGPIKVVLQPDGDMVTVRRNSRLSAAAEYCAGEELTYGCVDGWCGVCWHREKFTNGVFKPCCDVLTGDWDNVLPLVLTAKPEKAGDSTLMQPRGT